MKDAGVVGGWTTGPPGQPYEGSLQEVLTEVHKYMDMSTEDDQLVEVILATAISVALDRPVWVMIVAPPSSGKTELLKLIGSLNGYHEISSLTPKFLFSGHALARGGFMARVVGKKGIIGFKDLTTVLNMDANSRNQIFSQLRVVYDGSAGLGTGIDVSVPSTWNGKVAVIACVTETIELHKEVSADLGERFLFYRHEPSRSTRAHHSGPYDKTARRRAGELACRLVRRKGREVVGYKLNAGDLDFIDALAEFIIRGRAPVMRDGYARDIVLVPEPEQPHRVREALKSLYTSLCCLNDGDRGRPRRILAKVARSSIPANRLEVLREISRSGAARSLSDIMSNFRISETAVRRVLEDMHAQRLLLKSVIRTGLEHSYQIEPEYAKLWAVAKEEDLSRNGGGGSISTTTNSEKLLNTVHAPKGGGDY